MGERSKRNFRSHYYEKMGFRGVEEKKSLDILLRENPMDRDKIHNFCLRWKLQHLLRETHDQALPLTLKVTNIRPQCQVPPAQYLPSAGLAAAAGRAPHTRRQHQLRLGPEGRAVQGVSAGPGRHQEDLPRHALQHQDHCGLAPRSKPLAGRSQPTFLI